MPSIYVVPCTCGASTACAPPDDKDFEEEIACIVCSSKLNARSGRLLNRPIRIRKEEGVDLLAVE